MNIIVAVDQQWGIGKNNQLPWHIPEDLQFFKKMTLNKTIIMGRKTFESLPNRSPLPKRNHIILSKNTSYNAKNVITMSTLDQLLSMTRNNPSDDFFVIGGQTIYQLLLDVCQTAYVTKIHHTFETDTSFPNLDQHPKWHLEKEQPVQKSRCGHSFHVCTYINSQV